MEDVWIIGDSFVGATADHYFQNAGNRRDFYIKKMYDTAVMFNNKHFDACLLSRVRNVLVHAVNNRDRLPKAIVLVLDNDMIRFAGHDYVGTEIILKEYINWLATNMQEVLQEYKNKLTEKCKKEGYPRILWVESPLHCNFEDNHLRRKYNMCLYETLNEYDDVMPIKLKKEWHTENPNYFSNNRFTGAGLDKYWASIDSSFRHWETIVEKNGRFRRFTEKQQNTDENSI